MDPIKKTGRKQLILDDFQEELLQEYKEAGLSIRKITKVLQNSGLKISKSTVALAINRRGLYEK